MSVTTNEKAIRTPEGTEVWESTIEGAVWVRVVDSRGNERQVAVGPNKGQRLRIKVLDRENTQDSILNPESDPFSNGVLRRIDNLQPDHSPVLDLEARAYTDDALAVVMAMGQEEFQAAVLAMNERGVRLLKAYALSHDATINQLSFIQEEIDEKYKIEAVMPSTAEIIEAEQAGRDV